MKPTKYHKTHQNVFFFLFRTSLSQWTSSFFCPHVYGNVCKFQGSYRSPDFPCEFQFSSVVSNPSPKMETSREFRQSWDHKRRWIKVFNVNKAWDDTDPRTEIKAIRVFVSSRSAPWRMRCCTLPRRLTNGRESHGKERVIQYDVLI